MKAWQNSYDYGARVYDPRAGRFLSVDPLTRGYPMLTPYQYASNRPIDGIDLDGLEHVSNVYQMDFKTGKTTFKKVMINWDQDHWSEDNLLMIGTKTYGIGNQNPQVAAKAFKALGYPESGEWSDRYQDYKVSNFGLYDGGPNWTVSVKFTRKDLYEQDMEMGQTFVDALNTTMLILAPPAAAMSRTSLMGRGRPTNTAGITNELAPLSKADQKIVNAANSILNSKEFETIKNAFKECKEVTVKIGGRPIQYDPNWNYSEAMTNHEAGGFLLGPKAFVNPKETGKTVLHELYRLFNQGTKEIGVDKTGPYTNEAAGAANRLSPYLQK